MSQGNLKRELVERTQALQDALAQQAATSEVLRAISAPDFDLRAVFDTIARHAVVLCRAETCLIWRLDGEVYRLASSYGSAPEHDEYFYRLVVRQDNRSLVGRVALSRATVHVVNALADPQLRALPAVTRWNRLTMLGVPMPRGGPPAGVFALARTHVEPFDDRQIALVESFAAQALIAIEHVRLVHDLDEAVRERTRELEDARAQILELYHELAKRNAHLHEMLERMVQAQQHRATPRDEPAIEQLTRREREVLYLLAQGKTNGEIANALVISLATVKFHVEHIIAKLGVTDRTHAAVRAVELGLLPRSC